MLARFPDIAHNLETRPTSAKSTTSGTRRRWQAISLDSFLKQGLMEANSLLVIDLEKCTRCDACVRACSDAHDGVTRLIREGLRFDKFLVPTSCRHAAIRCA